MKIQVQCCGTELTTKNSIYLGRQEGRSKSLLLFNCPKCGTTVSMKFRRPEEPKALDPRIQALLQSIDALVKLRNSSPGFKGQVIQLQIDGLQSELKRLEEEIKSGQA